MMFVKLRSISAGQNGPQTGRADYSSRRSGRPAFQHLQHVTACDARTKKPVAINLANVSNLVTDRRDLTDSRLKPLLAVRRAAKTETSILPCVRREEQGRDLTDVKVVNNAQRL